MTGFGRKSITINDKKLTVEIKCLNSKTTDINCKLPQKYRSKEIEIRSVLQQKLERGKIDFVIYEELNDNENSQLINESVFKNYYQSLKKLAVELEEKSESFFPSIMRIPEVLKSEKTDASEEEWKLLFDNIAATINDVDEYRRNEGEKLEQEIKSYLNLILKKNSEIEKYESERIETVRERIKKQLAENTELFRIDEGRLEQEMIFYLEKFDISEEKVRLKTHCNYFLETINSVSSGRKLNFISQEIGREINTIGSKANHFSIQKIVVEMKDELEKIKEQLNNIL